MKSQRTNSTFANSNTQADTSVCKRAISCHSHLAKNKRTGSTKKQSFQLTNFCPFGAMTAWRWRKSIRVIIKSNYFSTFYAFVATFTRFFSSCVHKIKFKGLKTCSTLFIVERLFTTFLRRTNFYFFSNCCRRSTGGFSFWDKLSCSCISHSCRCFTHDFLILNYKSIITYYLTEPNSFSSLTKKRNIQLIEL